MLMNMAEGIVLFVCFAFVALGVVSDALNITFILEPMSWLLLAILAGMMSILPHLNVLMAKHLYGIESEIKKEQ